MTRLMLLVQLLVTLAILVALPATPLQALLLVGWWYVTLRPLRLVEILFFALVCILFTVMNALALRHGVFAFAQRDVLGMPYFELFMWGFYGLHMWRFLGGPTPAGNPWLARGLVLPFALSFALVSDAHLLLASAGFALVLALLFCHEPWDLAYVAYAIGLGTVIEYTGVASGLWHYPEGGVPLWYVALWGGVGLFLRRLFVPVLASTQADASVCLQATSS